MTRISMLAATLLVGLCVVAGSARGSPPGLTASGTALWNFEALLHATFGSKPVCVVLRSGRPDFVSKPCQSLSLAQMQFYEFTFHNAKGSAYHLVSRRVPPFAGNYPTPIEVSGRYVACDRNARSFLFTNGAQYGFTPGCYRSQPPP